ncbi:MAG: DUF1700 domain-containing protein [Lachnospiraceae bacterium]|nr:DUF1700 domain-containing protein [Lachnospiraceae bacterium]
MNKTEYIDMLRRHITEVGDPAFINDTVEYYTDYIDTAIRKGQTEEDVLATLGDPRLIAKSIVASRDDIPGNNTGDYYSAGSGYNTNSHTYSGGRYGESFESENSEDGRRYGIFDNKLHIRLRNGRDLSIPMAVVKVGGAATLLLLLFGVGYVTWQLMPVIGVGILAVLIYRFFKDNF